MSVGGIDGLATNPSRRRSTWRNAAPRVVGFLGLVVTILGLLWVGRLTVDVRRSTRVQRGPHVAATVTAVSQVTHGYSRVTLEYADVGGAHHQLQLRYP